MYAMIVCDQDIHLPERDTTVSPSFIFGGILGRLLSVDYNPGYDIATRGGKERNEINYLQRNGSTDCRVGNTLKAHHKNLPSRSTFMKFSFGVRGCSVNRLLASTEVMNKKLSTLAYSLKRAEDQHQSRIDIPDSIRIDS